jgi:hypothetical protein
MKPSLEKVYEMQGTPDASDVRKGTRILSMREVIELLKRNPEANAAGMERINRMEGRPRMFQRIIHKAKNEMDHAIVENNKFQIDAQMKKLRMA